MIEHDDRDMLQPQLPGSQHPRMAGDNPVIRTDQDRTSPAKLPDGGRHLGDLRLGMRARVPCERQQLVHCPEFDFGREMHQPGGVTGVTTRIDNLRKPL